MTKKRHEFELKFCLDPKIAPLFLKRNTVPFPPIPTALQFTKSIACPKILISAVWKEREKKVKRDWFGYFFVCVVSW